MTPLSGREFLLLSMVPTVFTMLTSCCEDSGPQIETFQAQLSAESIERLGAASGEAILTSSHLLIELRHGDAPSDAILGSRN